MAGSSTRRRRSRLKAKEAFMSNADQIATMIWSVSAFKLCPDFAETRIGQSRNAAVMVLRTSCIGTGGQIPASSKSCAERFTCLTDRQGRYGKNSSERSLQNLDSVRLSAFGAGQSGCHDRGLRFSTNSKFTLQRSRICPTPFAPSSFQFSRSQPEQRPLLPGGTKAICRSRPSLTTGSPLKSAPKRMR